MKYKDFFKEDILPGGKGDQTTAQSVDQKELAMGISVEQEHTQDPNMAKEIALDHLTEDPQYYSKLQQAGFADELGGDKNTGIKDIAVDPSKNQTTPGTTYPEVKTSDKGENMGGCIGNTNDIESSEKTDVDAPSKDPTSTDHVTGGMSGTPVNPNILSKSQPDSQPDGPDLAPAVSNDKTGTIGANLVKSLTKAFTPQDISIDIAEGKKILNKMMKDTTKEGYGGDPDTDDAYVKGKRWTVKWKQ